MTKNLIVFGLLVAVTAFLWVANLNYDNQDLSNVFYTAATFTVLYFVFRLLFEVFVAKQITNKKTRYSFRKIIRILFYVIAIVATLRIWVVNPEALVVAYGLVAAGVAISLQDVVKNLAGGVLIFFTGIYRAGNRIEVDGVFGDVIDVSLFYTTMLETRNWIGGDQATGRLTIVPNGRVLSGVVNNYTRGHQFLWDEINIAVTYESDWKKAMQMMRDIAAEKSEDIVEEARESWSHLEERYYMSERNLEPNTYIKADDTKMMLTLRYVVRVRERRSLYTAITEEILEAFDKEKSVEMAYNTISVTDFPGVEEKKEK